jgi:hypothetical protein
LLAKHSGCPWRYVETARVQVTRGCSANGVRIGWCLAGLRTRGNIAYQTGLMGKPAEALRLYLELLPDMARVLGPTTPKRSRPAGTSRTGQGKPEALPLACTAPPRHRVMTTCPDPQPSSEA